MTVNPFNYLNVLNPPGRIQAFFTCPTEQPPGVVSLANGNGGGVYADPNGASDLSFVQVLYAAAPNGGGQSFCFVTYDAKGNGLWLYGDEGFWIGPISPGQTYLALQNSLCAVNTGYSNVVRSGNLLTVNLYVLFKVSGTRNVYLRALDMAGADTGLVQKGATTLVAEPLGGMYVSPSSDTISVGGLDCFTLTNVDPPGFLGLDWAAGNNS